MGHILKDTAESGLDYDALTPTGMGYGGRIVKVSCYCSGGFILISPNVNGHWLCQAGKSSVAGHDAGFTTPLDAVDYRNLA